MKITTFLNFQAIIQGGPGMDSHCTPKICSKSYAV